MKPSIGSNTYDYHDYHDCYINCNFVCKNSTTNLAQITWNISGIGI